MIGMAGEKPRFSGVADGGDGGRHVASAEGGRTRDHDIRACLITGRRGPGVDAAVDLDVKRMVSLQAERRGSGDFLQHLRHEGLPAESWNHGHAEQEVDLAEKRRDRADRRRGIERESGLKTRGTDAAQGFRNIVLGLHMHGDEVRARIDEALKVMIRPGNHQVHVQKDITRGIDRGHHGGTE